MEDSQGDVTTSLHKLRLHARASSAASCCRRRHYRRKRARSHIAREKEALRQQRLANAVEFRKADTSAMRGLPA